MSLHTHVMPFFPISCCSGLDPAAADITVHPRLFFSLSPVRSLFLCFSPMGRPNLPNHPRIPRSSQNHPNTPKSSPKGSTLLRNHPKIPPPVDPEIAPKSLTSPSNHSITAPVSLEDSLPNRHNHPCIGKPTSKSPGNHPPDRPRCPRILPGSPRSLQILC